MGQSPADTGGLKGQGRVVVAWALLITDLDPFVGVAVRTVSDLGDINA